MKVDPSGTWSIWDTVAVVGAGIAAVALAATGVGIIADAAILEGALAGEGIAATEAMTADSEAVGAGAADETAMDTLEASTAENISTKAETVGEASAEGTAQPASDSLVSKKGTAVDTQTANQWHKGTFNSNVDSMEYHLAKHGNGRTIQQYTKDATDFFSQNKSFGQPHTLMDGSEGLKIKIGSGKNSIGGYWTIAGKIVTFWGQ
jgi:hypothetical protein